MELINSLIVLIVTIVFIVGLYYLKEYDLKRYNLCFSIIFIMITIRLALDRNVILGLLSLMMADLFYNAYRKYKTPKVINKQ